jgi:hypothetical protein
MNDREREAARLGMVALDASLVELGYPPVGDSPDVRMADPVILDIPNAVIEKPGCAPLRLIFGPDLDLWVGPYSEVILEPVQEETLSDIQDVITQVLRSEVTCHYRKRSVKLVLRIPGQDPWRRLTVYGAHEEARLAARYEPYARQL